MKNCIYFLVGALFFAAHILCAEGGSQKKFFVINEDNDHWFKQDGSKMTKAHLEKYIDSMADTNVTHFFMCANGQRTSYRTAVWEAIWDDVDGVAPTDIWAVNAKKLYDNGIDPYAVWTAQCRKRNISPWITMRMNDVHFVSVKNYFRNMEFWRKNPQLWRVPNSKNGAWTDCAFDYSKSEVREFNLKLVRELLERYDVDGIELDWMRFCMHLTPKKSFQQRGILTEFVREVKKITREFEIKRGHKIGLSARVPAEPEMSAWLGMDAVEWGAQKLVDFVTASCFFSSADFDMSAKKWRDAGLTVPLLCGTDNGACATNRVHRVDMDCAMYNAWAANMFYSGFDNGVYLFNLIYMPRVFSKVVVADWSESSLEKLPRRHILTFHDYMEVPDKSKRCEQLPRRLDGVADLKIQCGKAPKTGSLNVRADFKNSADFDSAKFFAILNGVKCKEVRACAPVEKKRKGAIFDFDISAARDGVNVLEIGQSGGNPQILEWAEIDFNVRQ